MIKKNTLAVFKDGDYKGEYDWTGGIPLTKDELVIVTKDGSEMVYKLVNKTTHLTDSGEDQDVQIKYYFVLD